MRQFIAYLLYSHTITAKAWSVVSRRSVASGLLANIGSFRASSSLSLANADGECGATPEIPKSPSSASAAFDASTSLSRKPKSGDIVTFTLLSFRPTGGDGHDEPDVLEPLFDTAGTLRLVLDGGNYLPGLHQLLSTMNPGETIEGATIDAGYGGYNPDLKFQISTSDIGDSIDTSLVKVGTALRMGNGMDCRVTEMNEKEWTLDANHVMAGSAYYVDVRLDRVEEGPKNWEYAAVGQIIGDKYEVATFALGCFWGGELAYQRMPGVVSTHVGYTQGHKEKPTYEEVCSGRTGHTEAIRVIYDPEVASYSSLVKLGLDRLGGDVYKLNQVGNDRGTQYRHGIYYHDDEQRKVAEELLEGYRNGEREVMTEVAEAKVFYMAEDYHQQYLLKGGQSAKKGASESIRCYG
eukprot:CAMPEP_0172527516 /NCGR_PEP_ID=MMETSP1067-20121228/2175_1 /TAXON_ID=265564 ORGANISM="Thalassiosira punctigera, Strain Tpunct2005C2" /NCGR_SAMPLE_ID=MMETSP1067 /ASSEMBLY_ACC=CAM_ASM_000444 /LENGTH=406 /DNA_ID=CAMNT_0013311265 /DNA_START=104 /DNA_END=1324 /DNA_ORIENTATION=-